MGRVRNGIIGGSFDPPHIGHLILAQSACSQYNLESVQWVVAADPPHKKASSLTDVETRLEMVRAAIQGNSKFALSRLDVDRPGPHYTVDMLEVASHAFEGSQLYFLLGSDSVNDLPNWHEPERLVDYATLVALRRNDVGVESSVFDKLSTRLRTNLTYLDGPKVDISSTLIRNLVSQNRSVRYLVPETVEAIITRQGLYKQHA